MDRKSVEVVSIFQIFVLLIFTKLFVFVATSKPMKLENNSQMTKKLTDLDHGQLY